VKTLAVVRLDPQNCGDLASTPSRYFSLGDWVREMDVSMLSPELAAAWKPDLVVIGGGGIFYPAWESRLAALVTLVRANGAKVVVWGAGTNASDEETRRAPSWLNQADLVGLRDRWPEGLLYGAAWVPCASCASRLLDHVPEPIVDFVAYSNNAYAVRNVPRGTEQRCVRDMASMEDAVAYLSRGRTILTTSYHGAYWGALLGRRVIAWAWASKMRHMMPEIKMREPWESWDARPEAPRPKAPLQRCREANAAFAIRVWEMLG
jgi:hypothetical protein